MEIETDHSLVAVTVVIVVDLSDTLLQSGNDGVESTETVLVPRATLVRLINGENGVVAIFGVLFCFWSALLPSFYIK